MLRRREGQRQGPQVRTKHPIQAAPSPALPAARAAIGRAATAANGHDGPNGITPGAVIVNILRA